MLLLSAVPGSTWFVALTPLPQFLQGSPCLLFRGFHQISEGFSLFPKLKLVIQISFAFHHYFCLMQPAPFCIFLNIIFIYQIQWGFESTFLQSLTTGIYPLLHSSEYLSKESQHRFQQKLFIERWGIQLIFFNELILFISYVTIIVTKPAEPLKTYFLEIK